MFLVQMSVKADAASISVVPGGSGVYVVKGFDFTDIGGVEIEIQYDTAAMANPRITQGAMLSSSMFIANPDCDSKAVASGTCSKLHNIKIGGMSLSAIKGSGDLATITFDLKSGKPGSVAIARSKMTTVTGTQPLPPSSTADTGGTGVGTIPVGGTGTIGAVTSSGGVSVSGGSSIGTITLPQEQVEAAIAERKAESEPLVTDLRKDMTLPLGDTSAKKDSAEEKEPEPDKKEQQKSVSYKGTLQLFKEFKGERTAGSLIPLFAEISLPDFTQEPPIAFADGITPLKITLSFKQSGSEAPKFMMQGANVKQLAGVGEGIVTWMIEAIPKKDAVDATLSIIDGQTVMDFPLTIVPRINPLLTKGKALSEADFTAYLAKPAKFDLNKDGKFDAVDDYIYTANYIVAMKIKPEKAVKEEKKEAPKPAAKDDAKAKKPAAVKDDMKIPAEKVPVKP